MAHYFSLVLVVWGLMIQPLIAAIPAKMTMDDHYVSHTINDFRSDGSGVHSAKHENPIIDHSKFNSDQAGLSPPMMPCHGMDNAVVGNNISKEITMPCRHCQSSDCAADCMSSSGCVASCTALGTLPSIVSASSCVSTNTQSVVFSYRSKSLLIRPPLKIFHPPKFA